MSQFYTIKSKMNGLALTAEGGGYQPNSKVTPQDPTGQDNQCFYDDPSTGTIRIKSSNFCLDIEDEKLVVRPFQNGDPNQQWLRADAHIRNKIDKNRVIDVYGENREKGATVGAYQFNGNHNQCFQFEYVGGAVPATGAQTYPAQYPAYPGYPAQGGPQHGGAYPAAGAPGSYPGGYPSQPVQQPQAPAQPRREFFLVSEMHGKVLDICKEDKNAGAKVIMYKKSEKNRKNQLWYLDTQGWIRSALNDFVFSNTESGKHIAMQPYSDNARGQWKVDGKRIVNKMGEVLDISGENKDDGAEVISYKDSKQKNQQWRQEFVN